MVSQDFKTKFKLYISFAEHSTTSALAGKHYASFNRPCVVPGGNVRKQLPNRATPPPVWAGPSPA